MVEDVRAGNTGQRQPGIKGYRRRGRHRAVAATDRKHVGTRGRARRSSARASSSGPQFPISAFGSAPITSSTTELRCRCPTSGLMTSTTPETSRAVRALATRSGTGRGRSGFDDRRDAAARPGPPARADAEPGDDITRVVRAGRHSRQSDQAGQKRQPEAQHADSPGPRRRRSGGAGASVPTATSSTSGGGGPA